MSRSMQLFCAAAVCALAGPVYAGIDNPPPWANWTQTGGLAHWFFDFSNGPSSPPQGFGPGTPQINLTSGGATWVPPSPTNPHGSICIPGGGFLDILVPNFNVPTHEKYIWVQTDYLGGPEPVISASFGAFGGSPWGPTVTPSPHADGTPGLISGAGWQLPFCPPFEIIHISNPYPGTVTYITWLSIDTICIPTPGAAAVIGLGSLLATRRRR